MKIFNGTSKHFSNTLSIAAPVVFENIMQSAVSMVNVAMVGSLGVLATAAVAVNSAPSWLLNSFPMGLSVGSTVLVARSIGARNTHRANEVASQSLGASIIFSTFICLLMIVLSQYIPAWLNADPEVQPNAIIYLRIVSLAIIPHFTGLNAAGILRGSGNTFAPMLASLMTNVINIALSFFLIFETRIANLFGLIITIPGAGLGVKGVAIATACAQTISAVFMITLLCNKKQRVTASFKHAFKIKKEVILKILKIGGPALGERITISFGQVLYQSMVNALGPISTSAHYIATTAESIAYMPAGAFSISATTLVGQSLGAKNKEDARKYAFTNNFCALLVGILCLVILLFFPRILILIFTRDPDVINLGSDVLRVMAPVEPFFCLLIVMTGVLRGGGDTVFALIAGICGMWGIRLGVAYITTNFLHMGLVGAWIGMAADIFLRFIIIFFRYKRKKWLENESI